MQTICLRNPAFDRRELRTALASFVTGVTIVTTCNSAGRMDGVTVNSFSALSLDPPLVLWSLRLESTSRANFIATNRFAVNVLSQSQRHLADRFAKSSPHKFSDVTHTIGSEGCPILENCLAVYQCHTEQVIEAGDHVLFVGRVLEVGFRDGTPLVFAGGRYCALAHPALLESDSSEVRVKQVASS